MTIRTPVLLAALALVAGCATRPAGAPAIAAIAVPADAPAALQPAAGQEPFLEAHASGVQVYECSASADAPAAWAWKFKSPEATLTGAKGDVIGRHFGGPSWSSSDGATVVGKVAASVPSPERGSIPWLLLAITSREGAGVLGAASSVQRLDTEGGVAPATPCGPANAHQVERVGYTATYVFWRAKPAA